MLAVAVLLNAALLGPIHVRASSYIVSIEPNDEVCFFEEMTQGNQLGLHYQVTTGGFFDIDVTILNKKTGVIMFVRERSTEDQIILVAQTDGVHAICFSNRMSTLSQKEVQFTITGMNSETKKKLNEEQERDLKNMDETVTDGANRLQEMITSAKNLLFNVREENGYMLMRIISHQKVNESTNSNVLYWSIFEAVVVICMSIGQVIYLKRIFEDRRLV